MDASHHYDKSLIEQVMQQTLGVEWITDPARVDRLGRDFAWFSPVLARELAGKAGDAVARPRTEDEVRRVVAACASLGVPITVRGSATGNYGQCTPMHGGVLLDLSGYNQFLWARAGIGRAQAGIRMGDFDDRARPSGWELRCVPSTFRSATLGGLYGGGFGGVGSINHGPLASTGNVLGVRVMSIEPEPQVTELRSPEALLLHHVYGTNGLVLELEVALAPAHPWLEAIVTFAEFDAALQFCDALASAPGVVKKSVTFLAEPVASLLGRAVPHLGSALAQPRHAALLLLAEWSEQPMLQFMREHGGTLAYRQAPDEVARSKRTLVEATWNHTTLHALKVDKGLTYIQSGFVPGQHLQQVRTLEKLLAGEVLMHLEFIRTKEGAMTCSGLQMVRYTTDERLAEIMQIHRDHGVYIANPHVWRVEDGKQGSINRDVVAAKQRFDPQGLLNPGKLRGWDLREQVLATPPGTDVSLRTLPSF